MDENIIKALMSGEDDTDLTSAIMLALGGQGRGGGTTGMPYRAPNVTTGMDAAVANLSLEASRNPFAIGHLMNAQAQARDAMKISSTLAQHFGNLNTRHALMQRAMGGQNAAIGVLLKNLHQFTPEQQNRILAHARMQDVQYTPEEIERERMKENVNIVKTGVDASKSGIEGGIDFREATANMLNQLGFGGGQVVDPLSMQTARINAAQRDQDKDNITQKIPGVVQGPQGEHIVSITTLKGRSPEELAKLRGQVIGTGFKPIDSIGHDLPPHELARLRAQAKALEEEEGGF